MGKFFNLIITSLLLAVLFSCEKTDENIDTDSDQGISVVAYAYVNEPIRGIKLAEISGQNTLPATPINSANIEVWQNDKQLLFHCADSTSGMYTQTNDSVRITPYEPIYLNIDHQGKAYRLMASVPPKIENLEIDQTDIWLNDNEPNQTLTTLTWSAIPGYKYCIFIRNVGADYTPIPRPENSHHGSAFYRLLSENRIELNTSDFTHFGHYKIYVTAVDDTYAAFYNNPENHAMLNELNDGLPAWGVFTAFNGDAVAVQVN